MGSKTRARQAMQAAGVPIIPGTTDPVGSLEELLALGEVLGYPLLIKAAAGGGGKGMEEVHAPDAAERAFATAQRQGQSYFASSDVYVEKLIVDPRHVEVQVLADAHGNVIHLGERDCTIQRRHQKLVEETPSPAVETAARPHRTNRRRRGACGRLPLGRNGRRPAHAGRRVLLHGDEHPHSGRAHGHGRGHGLDLVREQVRIALGEPLSLTQEQVVLRGHAIECRINAEDAAHGFLPSPGLVTAYREPSGPGVRVDSGVAAGSEISGVYDPMIAKLIVHGVDREHARRRMLRALDEFVIAGPKTLLGFHKALLEHDVLRARRDVSRYRRVGGARGPRGGARARRTWPRRRRPHGERLRTVEVDGRRFDVRVLEPEAPWLELARRRTERVRSGGGGGADAIVVADAGHGAVGAVADGDTVETGQVLCIVEAMKMENEVRAPHGGVVAELSVAAGEPVGAGTGDLCARRWPKGRNPADSR